MLSVVGLGFDNMRSVLVDDFNVGCLKKNVCWLFTKIYLLNLIFITLEVPFSVCIFGKTCD